MITDNHLDESINEGNKILNSFNSSCSQQQRSLNNPQNDLEFCKETDKYTNNQFCQQNATVLRKKWAPTQKIWTLTKKKEPYSIIILSNLKL